MSAGYRAFTPAHIDTSHPHPGRVYNALLGGKDHYPVDEAVAEGIMRQYPNATASTWAARHFTERIATWMAQSGIRQFLDLGCGASIEPDLPQIVQHVVPEARVVCVDSDPIVARRAEALITGAPQGRTVFLQADITDPASVLDSPQVQDTLDLSQPVGLVMNNILCFIDNALKPHEVVAAFVDAIAPGSYMSICHPTADFRDMSKVVLEYNSAENSGPLRLRSRADIERFFTGLEFVDPGLTTCHNWRPEIVVPRIGTRNMPSVDSSKITDQEDSKYAGVAVKR